MSAIFFLLSFNVMREKILTAENAETAEETNWITGMME